MRWPMPTKYIQGHHYENLIYNWLDTSSRTHTKLRERDKAARNVENDLLQGKQRAHATQHDKR